VERDLDFEPMRQGEEECAAALRLLRRMRQNYGRRFFDVVVVDPGMPTDRFLKPWSKNWAGRSSRCSNGTL